MIDGVELTEVILLGCTANRCVLAYTAHSKLFEALGCGLNDGAHLGSNDLFRVWSEVLLDLLNCVLRY